ncbi:FAD/FMN-containing dehydrogenase [Sinorhizobium fredii]|uniref:Glycolate oxidase subunit GlcD n=1 Tax=Sinorhizobium fredii (strain USDA 257) TaxID=1185652 RepID=I3X3G2_SINF2|nr:FAD-binding oxidoreductase [Sinorhizobium fredii]AFL50418.1 glycolate oxidase subunit GlcD [Sinorhizobium fredii USDA 257]
MAPYLVDWRSRYRGTALGVVEPSTADEVAVAVRIASAHGVKVVPQGGNTGLVGGGVPLTKHEGSQQIVVSLRRLNRIRDLDLLDNVIVVEAGVILQNAQAAARTAGRLLPISLAAEGSAQIGGIVSTNAGGTNVLRFGSTRELVLGLEVILADGSIWNGLQRLRKNNAGYDLKQLFIGSEGTLGIVTAAAIKLFPLPHSCVTTFIAVPSPAAAVRLLRYLQSELGDSLTAFELIERVCLDLVFGVVEEARDPFEQSYPWYVLAEVSATVKEVVLDDIVERSLASAFEIGIAMDAVLAQSEKQRVELWRLRDEITEAERRHGPSAKHDISIPVSRISDFLARAPATVRTHVPHARPIAFGHVGDGNIHFNVLAPAEDADCINRAVYDLVTTLGGSISAEHGIGQSKIELLAHYKDRTSLSLMQRVRRALDPSTTFNPGKLVHVPPVRGSDL